MKQFLIMAYSARAPRRRAVWFAALILAMSMSPGARAADMSDILTAELGVVNDDNLTRAEDTEDQIKDTSVWFGISMGKRAQINASDRVSATVDFKNSTFLENHKLNNYSIGLSIGYFHKLGLGADAAWWRVFGSAARQDWRESARDGSNYELGVQAGKRVGGLVDASVVYSLQNRTGHTLGISGSIPVFRAATLSVGYGLRRGDVTIHNEYYWPPDSEWMYVRTFDERMAAYRVPAQTSFFTATFTWPLDDASALYLNTERQDTQWDTLRYPNDIWRLGITRRFR